MSRTIWPPISLGRGVDTDLPKIWKDFKNFDLGLKDLRIECSVIDLPREETDMRERLNLTPQHLRETVDSPSSQKVVAGPDPASTLTRVKCSDVRDIKEKIAMDSNQESDDRKSDTEKRKRLAEVKRWVERGTAYEDDEEAPPVDIGLLRRYRARQATPAEDERVEEMLLKHRLWVEKLRRLEQELGGDGDVVPPSPT